MSVIPKPQKQYPVVGLGTCSGGIFRGSSLHNIIFNAFRLVFVLCSLLQTNRAFSLIQDTAAQAY